MLYSYKKREVKFKVPKLPSFKKKRSLINIALSAICFTIGLGVLFYSLYPRISYYYNSIKGTTNVSKTLLSPSPSESTGLVTNNSTDTKLAFTSDYVQNVSRNFSVTNKLLNLSPRTHPEYANIQGEMLISIPKLGFSKIPIKVNVDSFDEASYMPLLDKTLAHFLGSSLPDKPGNTFIYGHSTNELWAKTDPSSPKYAFTFLNKLDIGDELIIEYSGSEYRYTTQKINMVPPTDISPIYTTSDAKVLTLMTCWPPGIGSERMIVSAKQTN